MTLHFQKYSVFIVLFFALSLFTGCSLFENPQKLTEWTSWKYKKGFQKEWLTEQATSTDWKEVSVPQNFTKHLKLSDYTGYLTLQTEIPTNFNDQIRDSYPLAIDAGRLLDVALVYANNTLVGKLGSAEPYQPGAMRPFLKTIPASALHESQTNRISIVLYTNKQYPLQIMDPIVFGQANAVFGNYVKREVVSFSFLSMYLLMAAYHMLLGARRPKDKYNFHFGIFSLVISVYWFLANTYLRDEIFGNHVELHRRLEHVLLFLTIPPFMFFFSQFFEKKNSLIAKVTLVVGVVLSILTMVGSLWLMRLCTLLWNILFLGLVPYILYTIYKQIRKGNGEAYYLLTGIILLFGSGINDIASSENLIHTPKVASYFLFTFIVGIAGIMAKRFMQVTNQVEELNANLEQKVEQRTHELSESLDQIRELKEKQDGDYFLTSLLIRPLNGNFESPGITLTESIVSQKKKFEFRGKEAEIGGDLVYSDRISLGRHSYLVFLNADAMGKSIQGAGGALVIGSIFRSIIERNKISPDLCENISPEEWLKDSYWELQNVFTSFDGSMMVSATMGLLQEDNGFLSFVNAEHPWMVLLRDGKASFLENGMYQRKLGVPQASLTKIQTFKLMPGDAIFIGSDGKDDLVIGESEDGSRIINEDETRFLQFLEDTQGSLSDLKEKLEDNGELMDDLSILKISYSPNTKEATGAAENEVISIREEARRLQEDHNLKQLKELLESSLDTTLSDSYLTKQLADTYSKLGEKVKAIETALAYVDRNPQDIEIMFRTSLLAKKTGKLTLATTLSERILLRYPDHSKNLIQLIDLYRLKGKKSEARKLLQKAKELEPGSILISKLEELLSKEE